MGVFVDWDDADQTSILIAYEDPWTWDDFYSAMQKLDDMLSEAPPTGLIFDFSGSRSIPANAFSHFRRIIEYLEHSSCNTTVISVDVQGMWRAILNVFMLMYPNIKKRSRFAGNLEEARSVIYKKTLTAVH